MRIGELAKRSQMSRDTIRFYERNGLIFSMPSSNATNSYKEYFEETVEILAMIKEAQDAGFSIADLVLFIKQMSEASVENFDAEDFLQTKIDEIEERIHRSRRFVKTLKATKDALATPRGRK